MIDKNKSMFRLDILRNVIEILQDVAGMSISRNTDNGF